MAPRGNVGRAKRKIGCGSWWAAFVVFLSMPLSRLHLAILLLFGVIICSLTTGVILSNNWQVWLKLEVLVRCIFQEIQAIPSTLSSSRNRQTARDGFKMISLLIKHNRKRIGIYLNQRSSCWSQGASQKEIKMVQTLQNRSNFFTFIGPINQFLSSLLSWLILYNYMDVFFTVHPRALLLHNKNSNNTFYLLGRLSRHSRSPYRNN